LTLAACVSSIYNRMSPRFIHIDSQSSAINRQGLFVANRRPIPITEANARSEAVRAMEVSSIAPNKANFCRFWAGNGGGVEKQSQSKPICGWWDGIADWVHSTTLRTASPISDLRFNRAALSGECEAEMPNKANLLRFQAENGGAVRKQSQSGLLAAEAGVGRASPLAYRSRAGTHDLRSDVR
jgi:hypothetical protein